VPSGLVDHIGDNLWLRHEDGIDWRDGNGVSRCGPALEALLRWAAAGDAPSD
jgi:hypothetical protein